MFTMLHSIFVYFLVQWLSQHWGEPLVYWLLGYFTACLVATLLVLLYVWLLGRTRRVVRPHSAGSAAKQATTFGVAIGG
ncbi:MAG: hypothetical protein AB7O59_09635 [Pirellulales bacterium]